ncbi:hypothetical protein JCM8202_002603 [Rhodotorula sphaerocarpa]
MAIGTANEPSASASRSATPEPEGFAAITFDEHEDHDDNSSAAQSPAAAQSEYDSDRRSQLSQEHRASGDESREENASGVSAGEPPAQSTTPLATPAASIRQAPDEAIIPVTEDPEEATAASTHETAVDKNDEDKPASPAGPARSTPSLAGDEEKPEYPPLSNKSSIFGRDSSTLPVLESQTPVEPVLVPPDGGWKAWLNVLGGFLILFASFGLVSAFGVFQAYFTEFRYTSHSESEISWIGSCQLCLFFLCALVAGPLFDRGKFRYLIGVGSVLWTASVFLIPEAKTFGQCMFIQGIVGGIGVGLLFLPSLSIQSHWFAARRSMAIGIVASGTSAGGICLPILLNKLIANPDVGFDDAVRAVAALVGACLLVANIIMSPHPARKIVKKPPPPPLKQIFTLPYSFLVAGAFILNWGLWFPNFYVQLYFKQQGASQEATYYALAIFNAGSFLGRVLPNLVADQLFGPFNMQALCCLCSGVMIFLMRVMTSQGLLILWALLCGFFTGGFISLVSPVIVSVSNNNLAEVGLRQGVAFVLIAGSAVGGNPVCGRLLSNERGDFLSAILFAGTTVMLGASLALVGRMIFAMQKGTWRV